MNFRLGQPLSRLVPSHSVAGGTLHERLRSTTFALCGAAAAVGLGLVALVANQTWPGPLDSGIPPIPRLGVHGARALTGSSSPSRSSGRPRGGLSGTSSRPAGGGSETSGSRIGSHRQFAGDSPGAQSPAAPPPGGNGGGGAPAGAPAPEPASVTPQPATAPAPVPTPGRVEGPAPENASNGHGKAKGHEKHGAPAEAEDPAPPAAPEAPAPPESVPPGHAKDSSPGQAHGHGK